MLKVVFDTNVYISAFITPGGRAEEAYLLAIDGRVDLFTSIAILTELARKLRDKFLWDDQNITSAIRHISTIAAIRKPSRRMAILKDDADNRILECAVDAGADLLVTGDKHLLKLGTFEGVRIVTIADFMKMIGSD